ncbi:MAG: protein kinase domain-containing protein [Chloroflexota bacterium]
MTLESGTLLHKRYRIVECLAQGGMGSVYTAMDENLGMVVAVKENLFTTEEYSRQFRLEAVILANLRHPNLPRVSDHFTIEGQGQYLVMDYIEGEDLRQRMERIGTLSEDEVVVIGASICDALTYLHSRTPPILHRDIKPGNVKITPGGHIILVDFGLAKVLQGNQATTVGARAMTPGYSPPEQYGTGRTDPRTDIYSLGATLYAAITGVIPEDGLARAMDNVRLSPLRKRNPKTSRKLALAIERAMSVDPMDRYQTAEDFKRALLETQSKTQQPVGAYIVAPPPASSEADTQGEARPRTLLSNPPSSQQDIPFVSPMRKQKMRASRIRRAVIGGLLVVLALGFVGLRIFAPGLAWPGLLPATATQTKTPANGGQLATPGGSFVFTPTPSPTFLPPTATLSPVPPTPAGLDTFEVAFASIRDGLPQIYIVNMQGEETRLTDMPNGACQPSWSPDGTRLVFVSPCTVRQDVYRRSSLYIINADGSGLESLSTVPGGDFEPDWSPDGLHIAFTSLRTGHMQVYSYDLSTGLTTRLIRTPQGQDARQPVWSPDGTQIAYALRRNGSTYQIWVMSSDGGDEHQLVRSGDQLSDMRPEWSPDGSLILFHQTPADKFAFPDLVMYLLDSSSNPVILKLGVLSINNVDYSPDGRWLAFETAGQRGADIAYMTASGSDTTQLTDDPAEDFDPTWRPPVK